MAEDNEGALKQPVAGEKNDLNRISIEISGKNAADVAAALDLSNLATRGVASRRRFGRPDSQIIPDAFKLLRKK
jgi:hypothetical protein